MDIYIDESGSFLLPPTGRHRMSCVAALIVPSCVRDQLFYEFLRLRDGWPHKAVEVKGSELAETEVAAVVNLLLQFDVTLEVFGTDMSLYSHTELDSIQKEQARLVTVRLTPEHSSHIRQELETLRDGLAELPAQLFVQLMVTTFLVEEVIQTSTLYYCQRLPYDLAEFDWVVDAKDRDVTQAEEIWRQLLLPFLQQSSFRRPLLRMVEGDYSGFNQFLVNEETKDPILQQHISWLKTRPDAPVGTFSGVNIKRLFRELHFRDSQSNLGIQLADIVANTFTRAFNGTLAEPGWARLGSLMVCKRDRSFHIKLGAAPAGAGRALRTVYNPRFAAVHEQMEAVAKSMMTS